MESYAIGLVEFDQCELDYIKPTGSERFFVYWYGYECYDGWGVALVVHQDGRLSYWEISHCSCNGPIDYTTWPGFFVTRDEWDKVVAERTRGYDPESIMSKYEEPWVKVDQKLRELIG